MWKRFGRYGSRSKTENERQGDIYTEVRRKLKHDVRRARNPWRRHTDFGYLKPFIDTALARATYAAGTGEPGRAAAGWIEILALRSPAAAIAQAHMDKHTHDRHNREARVLELIDFNDAYIQAVFALPAVYYPTCNNDLKALIDWFCKRVGAWTFSEAQFTAITHGLSREIAVFNAVRAAGFAVQMTGRTEDALGIDLRIADPRGGRHLNVDTKTGSAYRYRLLDLLREGRLSEADVALAERRGYVAVINGHGAERTRVILWRIDHESLGTIINFAFEHTGPLIAELGRIMQEYGEEGNV